MLLTITTTHEPATDLGFLLHKHPARVQRFDLSFGSALIYYPEVAENRCTAAMLLHVDPVELVRRGKTDHGIHFDNYVNERVYVASSFLSVALSNVFGDALKGKCKSKSELAKTAIPLAAKISVLPARGEGIIQRLFEPLGYKIKTKRHPLDKKFPDWGQSPFYTVELKKTTRLSDMLAHLYVLVPVLDNNKHYYIDAGEVDKLLNFGKGWLATHPAKGLITRRYLKFKKSLAREAFIRLQEERPAEEEPEHISNQEDTLEEKLNLNQERLGAVLSALRSASAKHVLDLGCGEGKLLRLLLKDKEFEKITGVDVNSRALDIAENRLRLERLPQKQRERITLIQGSLMYRDARFEGYDAATVIEVIEHLDPPRLLAFQRVLFEFARPKTIILTTPNREYNVLWESLGDGKLRHRDHRFEWSRAEFKTWCRTMADTYSYDVRYLAIGDEVEDFGSPTQMAVYTLSE